MNFKSKRDWFFPIILLFVAVLYTSIALFIWFFEDDREAIYGMGGVFLLLYLLLFAIQKTTFYHIDQNNTLTCRTLLFKKRIAIDKIKSIQDSNGLFAGWKMNTAWKCIVITYNKYEELLISPDDELLFIKTLTEINPNIYVKSNF
jgi:hypothetical protein